MVWMSFISSVSLFPTKYKGTLYVSTWNRRRYGSPYIRHKKKVRALYTQSNSSCVDYSLYLVAAAVDTRMIEAALRGGVTLLQYRDKQNTTRDMIRVGTELFKIARRFQIPFLLNDRVDVALAVDADGVHIGQDDMPLGIARKLLGKDKIIGVSVGNEEEARLAEQQGASYIGVGPIFATSSKPDAGNPIGLEALKSIASAVSTIPIVAIGGINEHNASQCIANGANGVAVISAILSSNDPEKAARNIRQRIPFL